MGCKRFQNQLGARADRKRVRLEERVDIGDRQFKHFNELVALRMGFACAFGFYVYDLHRFVGEAGR